MSAYQAKYNARTRPEERKGVYLAVLKTSEDDYLLKVGKTGDGLGGFRSRAGRLAAHARGTLGIDIDWAEIVYVIEEDDFHERAELEATVLAYHEPDYGYEFYDGRRWDEFTIFRMMGKPFEKRTTYASRHQEFLAWLALRE